MPSPGSSEGAAPSPRRAVERVLRGIALLALGGLVWCALHASRARPEARAEGRALQEALVRWSTGESPGHVHVDADSAPTPEVRDWLAALGGAGTPATWSGAAPPPIAVAVERVVDPRHSARIWVAAPAGARILLRDELGALDSATVARGGTRLVVPALDGTVRARVQDAEAAAAARDSFVLRPVLVLGMASWEAKFVLAALEEHGWQVETRLAVAPSGDVRQGAARMAIDTGRYAAVIALDSVAARYAVQLGGYVRQGGGLLAMGEAASVAALTPLLPATVIAPPSLPGTFAPDTATMDANPRDALALAPLGRLKQGALVLETRAGRTGGAAQVAAAAWRVGQGRVVQIGYRDTWRWRMAGAEAHPVRAHRAWWAALVSAVAYAPRLPAPVAEPFEPTPLASLVATLGPPKPRPAIVLGVLDDPRLVPLLFGLLLAALGLEWTSRRLRGAR
jgi:hypothetical protein